MSFEPIAIIGRACLLPGALTPQQLWKHVVLQTSCLKNLSQSPDGKVMKEIFTRLFPKSHSSKLSGGYVEGFETIFDPTAYPVSKEFILKLDPLIQWLLYLCFQAIRDARLPLHKFSKMNAGAIFGNLCLPTASLIKYYETTWLLYQSENIVNDEQKMFLIKNRPQPLSRFSTGLTATIVANILNLNLGGFVLDAACASAIYALKLACDYLHDGRATVMLAGALNRADDILFQVGLHSAHATSLTGQCKPLSAYADGLVPAEGACVFVLKSLKTAIDDNDSILAVIRGIGLSNDGAERSLLVPAELGQVQAMCSAYRSADIDPKDVSWIECHATGTVVGDTTEIKSMMNIFNQPVAIGALKGITGHTLTASAGAALIKVLEALHHKVKPPTPFASSHPLQILKESSFQLLTKSTAWESKTQKRLAAINAFGFGGNNAHMIIEEWQPQFKNSKFAGHKKNTSTIAIVGIGIIASTAANINEFINILKSGQSTIQKWNNHELGGRINQIELDTAQIHYPPNDLKTTLGQQLAMLYTTQQALFDVKTINTSDSAALIGMSSDTEACLASLLYSLPYLQQYLNPSIDNLEKLLQHLTIKFDQPSWLLGILSNIVANRLNGQFNLRGPSFCIAAEELSGIVALQRGCRALHNHEISCAIVGAVDMCCTTVHADAAKQLLGKGKRIPGDAAVTLILKRLEDALTTKDKIYALVDENATNNDYTLVLSDEELTRVTELFGHAHAASGLLHLATCALMFHYSFMPHTPAILNTIKLIVQATGGMKESIYLSRYRESR